MTQTRSRKDTDRRSVLILAALERYWQDNLRSPTLAELAQLTGFSATSAVRWHLLKLEREGRLTYNRVVARGIVPAGMRVVFE